MAQSDALPSAAFSRQASRPGSRRPKPISLRPAPQGRVVSGEGEADQLSFNIYDICYARTKAENREYIDEVYNAKRLTAILTEVADIIGALILNVAKQDYDPQGASVTMLISEGHHDGLQTPEEIRDMFHISRALG